MAAKYKQNCERVVKSAGEFNPEVQKQDTETALLTQEEAAPAIVTGVLTVKVSVNARGFHIYSSSVDKPLKLFVCCFFF